jgi:hypothetical protein
MKEVEFAMQERCDSFAVDDFIHDPHNGSQEIGVSLSGIAASPLNTFWHHTLLSSRVPPADSSAKLRHDLPFLSGANSVDRVVLESIGLRGPPTYEAIRIAGNG